MPKAVISDAVYGRACNLWGNEDFLDFQAGLILFTVRISFIANT